ncbi:MAG: TrkH family potassium uptake protein [Kiritimatiellae bacterium]|jgi:trk system potassium uptake protein TrkH|nr:TrkH family potassium uptake protein [Kiritimatiellia bacterium]
MNVRAVFHLISYLIFFVAIAMGISVLVAWGYGDGGVVIQQMCTAAATAAGLGFLLNIFTRGPVNLTRRDGFAIVSIGWLAVGMVGTLPYLLTGSIHSPLDALFETISGFTTTGSTIIVDIEVLPRGIVFWRSLTQWMGGMGVLLLCVAILPFLGVGGMQIYRAEMPGPSKDRLTPRIANTAKLLYGVYVLITVLEVVALMLAGLTFFDAVNHAFTTMPGGGFSPYNASIAHYDSPAVHLVITFFMILAGMNFALHYRALRGDISCYWKSSEWKVYIGIILGATALISVDLIVHRAYGTSAALVDGLFQVCTILTTTGFATRDYDLWPLFSKTILFILLFSGGCAGSTSGGIKLMRTLVVFKECARQIRLFMQPQAVIKIRMDKHSVSPAIVSGILGFYLLYFIVFTVASLLMTLVTPDLQTAASAVIACMSNVGPGFSLVGPTANFAHLADAGKFILVLCMLLGRLELFTVLVLFSPRFWKR